ncbi:MULTISPECIES: elongation factor G-like protein EF-G2 [unclassified Pseudonocardia]|uniref:elongation factor G-like protein EF-G2 n=1 Tax=unclassified Pseudonocardia TaxID=2619320 RepID=UPI000966F653|nr:MULTISPECIES: elongation factor G-like protein EF-G2 [unclassified Pseudonocardia]MBN9097719.1 elongation factor G-like protein EF-G2 [Pseudonocardia sp.]OJY40011.1 MAG: elongation factor G [Pseudonocardia sp. 73-21]
MTVRSAGRVGVVDPARIRNVVLVGPSGAGKTTLVEALLAHTAAIPRAGAVPEGTTVCDHDPAAVRQQRSVGLAVAPLMHDGHKINLIDTPGYGDFVGELRAGLRAADAALFVVPASQRRDGGPDPATLAQWEECAAVGMPRAIVVTRCDHARADVAATVTTARETFGSGVAPLYLPVLDGPSLSGLYGLLSRTPAGQAPDGADDARGELIEGIIEQSEDETLMERYLGGEDLDVPTLIDDLETAVARGTFHPVIPVCATSGIGLDAVLEVLVGGFPSPLEHPLPDVHPLNGAAQTVLTTDPDGPLAAEVVRTSADAYVGRVSLVRVFSGTLRRDTTVHVSGHPPVPAQRTGHDTDEKLAHLYSPLGATLREVDECGAGDICALTKIGSAETGDTVSAVDHPLLLSCWDLPEPLLPVAVAAHARGDEDALVTTLAKLVAADPTLRLERNAETHQTVLWCMGEAHADVVLSRLRASGTEVDTEPVRVPMRATLAGPARVTGRHVKQSGGHGQYAVCHVEFEPLPRGSGIEFVSKVVGGSVPTQFVPSVEKGIRTQVERGLGSADDSGGHHTVIDIRATLVDGKAHSVDSSDAAFQTAGALALREAAEACGVVLLEPFDEVAVRVPDEHLGAVLGDLSGRRGRVLGTDAEGAGRSVVRAEVPVVELLRYAVDLRAMTSGAATFTRHFARYDLAPAG